MKLVSPDTWSFQKMSLDTPEGTPEPGLNLGPGHDEWSNKHVYLHSPELMFFLSLQDTLEIDPWRRNI
jgi:hypothetical protein